MGKGLMTGAVTILSMCMIGCAGQVTYTEPGQMIEVSLNEKFVVTLDGENYDTGWGWQASYDDSMLKLVDFAHTTTGVGQFNFEAVKTGATEISMVYGRMWPEQPEYPPMETPAGGMPEPEVFAVDIR